MRAFFKSSVWSIVAISARTLSSLAIGKMVALQFGPNGITLLAHFQNLITISTTVPNDGINLGLITYLAGKDTKNTEYRHYFIAGALWQLLLFGVVVALFLLQQDFYLGAFLGQVPVLQWGCFFFAGLALLLISIYFQAIFLAQQAIKIYTFLVAFSSLGSAILIWLFLDKLSLPYLLLLYLVSQAATAFFAIVIATVKNWLPKLHVFDLDKTAFRNIGKFILMALTLVICSKLVSFYVRQLMIDRFGLYQTGLWQTVVRLSDNYTILFTSLLGTVYYPKIAALVPDAPALKKYVRGIFFLLVPGIAAGLLLFYLLRDWFILLLFDDSFLPATSLLDYQVLGDFFKMSAWILSYIITAQARTYLYIIIQVIAAGVYLLLLFWLVNQFGLKGVTMAHCASFGLFLAFNLVYFRKLIF